MAYTTSQWIKYRLYIEDGVTGSYRSIARKNHSLVANWLDTHPGDASRYGTEGFMYFDILTKAENARDD